MTTTGADGGVLATTTTLEESGAPASLPGPEVHRTFPPRSRELVRAYDAGLAGYTYLERE